MSPVIGVGSPASYLSGPGVPGDLGSWCTMQAMVVSVGDAEYRQLENVLLNDDVEAPVASPSAEPLQVADTTLHN